jgi:hypothetical protein
LRGGMGESHPFHWAIIQSWTSVSFFHHVFIACPNLETGARVSNVKLPLPTPYTYYGTRFRVPSCQCNMAMNNRSVQWMFW